MCSLKQVNTLTSRQTKQKVNTALGKEGRG